MLAVKQEARPTALKLKQHPWLQPTIPTLPSQCQALHDLVLGHGVHAIKYGRQGFPHTTSLRVCRACRALVWTSKHEPNSSTTCSLVSSLAWKRMLSPMQPRRHRHKTVTAAASSSMPRPWPSPRTPTPTAMNHDTTHEDQEEDMRMDVNGGTTSQETLRINPCHHRCFLVLDDILSIMHGTRTIIFERARTSTLHPPMNECACSILTRSRSLDVTFENAETRDFFIDVLTHVIITKCPIA
jgi:hypothetical protein